MPPYGKKWQTVSVSPSLWLRIHWDFHHKIDVPRDCWNLWTSSFGHEFRAPKVGPTCTPLCCVPCTHKTAAKTPHETVKPPRNNPLARHFGDSLDFTDRTLAVLHHRAMYGVLPLCYTAGWKAAEPYDLAVLRVVEHCIRLHINGLSG